MKLADAHIKILNCINIPFKDLYIQDELKDIIIAKGNTGKLLEKIIGLKPSITLKDFEDGELKSNKCDRYGNPQETMFISQISMRFDDLINPETEFIDSWVFEKIRRFLYVPVNKESKDPRMWNFLQPVFFEIQPGDEIFNILKTDFDLIKLKIINDIKNTDGIHTSSGTYIQIRTKDAKPYSPIYSTTYEKHISNKNFAFYFKKGFMRKINPISNG